MYIGGFEGNTFLPDNARFPYSFIQLIIILPHLILNQIHFPKLVEIPKFNIYLVNNPDLCYIGELEYYKASSNQTVIYSTAVGIPRKSYSDCGMLGLLC